MRMPTILQLSPSPSPNMQSFCPSPGYPQGEENLLLLSIYLSETEKKKLRIDCVYQGRTQVLYYSAKHEAQSSMKYRMNWENDSIVYMRLVIVRSVLLLQYGKISNAKQKGSKSHRDLYSTFPSMQMRAERQGRADFPFAVHALLAVWNFYRNIFNDFLCKYNNDIKRCCDHAA